MKKTNNLPRCPCKDCPYENWWCENICRCAVYGEYEDKFHDYFDKLRRKQNDKL